MALTQNGAKITGTFTSDHTGEVRVEGEFANGTLTFAIDVHGDSGSSMHVDFTGKMKDDGTLTGTLKGQMGEMTWTARALSSDAETWSIMRAACTGGTRRVRSARRGHGGCGGRPSS